MPTVDLTSDGPLLKPGENYTTITMEKAEELLKQAEELWFLGGNLESG